MKNSYLFIFLLITSFSCMDPVPRKPVSRKTSSSYLKESVKYNKKVIADEEEILKKIILKDSLNKYIASSKGFWYKYQNKSKLNYYPKFGDKLLFNYEVYTINNELIYSFNEIGNQTYVVDQQELVEGLRNGLKLMKEGDEISFLFPSHKMYGYLGDKNKIRVNQPVKIKVQLIKIIKKNESN